MRQQLIDAALDWQSQKVDFEPDGALRDIYVQHANIEDWKKVIAFIVAGPYRAKLSRAGADVPFPDDFELLFPPDSHPYFLSLTVGSVGLDCHFFVSSEIEFSFGPEDVTETSLRDLLGFMIDLGKLTRKRVILTPENGPEHPIFTYDPTAQRLSYNPPAR